MLVCKALSSLILLAVLSSSVAAKNLKAEEIIAKHLDSIGPREKRAALTTLMALGYSEFESLAPQIKGGGKAVIVSNSENLFFVISLNSKAYPYEKIGYFKGKPSLPFISPGARSLLGTFVSEHERVLAEGLFGGAMTLRWPLASLDRGTAKVKAGGDKKVDGKKAYILDYVSTGGSGEFSIKLFFDADTFRHVRTEYRREVTRGQMTFGQQNQQANAVITLSEDFSDFRAVDSLTLPFAHTVTFSSNSNTTSNVNIWRVKVAEYRLNQALQADFFKFDSD